MNFQNFYKDGTKRKIKIIVAHRFIKVAYITMVPLIKSIIKGRASKSYSFLTYEI